MPFSKEFLAQGERNAAFAVSETLIDDPMTQPGSPGNNNDHLAESGENVLLRPRLVNSKIARATFVYAYLTSNNTNVEIPPPNNWKRYNDMLPGTTSLPYALFLVLRITFS